MNSGDRKCDACITHSPLFPWNTLLLLLLLFCCCCYCFNFVLPKLNVKPTCENFNGSICVFCEKKRKTNSIKKEKKYVKKKFNIVKIKDGLNS